MIARAFIIFIVLLAATTALADDWDIVVSDGECELWTLLKYHDVDAELCRLASLMSSIGLGFDIAYQHSGTCKVKFSQLSEAFPEYDPVMRSLRGESSLIVNGLIKDLENGKVVRALKDAEPEVILAAFEEWYIRTDYAPFCDELVMLTSATWEEWLREHFPGNTVEWVSRSSYGVQ